MSAERGTDQPVELAKRLQPALCHVVEQIRVWEETKAQPDASAVLQDAQLGWLQEDVQWVLDNGGEKVQQDLSFVCNAAMRFQNVELYTMLTGLEVAPYYDIYDASKETWLEYQGRLFNLADARPRITIASLRFFRTGDDGFENLWQNYVKYLLNLAWWEEVCDNVEGLGSITRIVWNCSDCVNRPKNLYELVKRVWTGFLDKKEEARLTQVEEGNGVENRLEETHVRRVSTLLGALLREGQEDMFRDEETWTAVAVRNLLSESLDNRLLGQLNHGTLTKTFCEQVGLDFGTLDQVL